MTGKRLEDVREELEQEAVQRIAELEAEVERLREALVLIDQRADEWDAEASKVERIAAGETPTSMLYRLCAEQARAALADEGNR